MDPSYLSELKQWYGYRPATAAKPSGSAATEAFRKALQQFTSGLAPDDKAIDLTKAATSIDDIKSLATDSLNRYSNDHTGRFVKARKWLSRVLGILDHYANIFDVFVQHHPEYVALAWGAMKFLLVSVQNHQATVALISKALSQIGEALPQVELATILYPTERMIKAVEKLYSDIIHFFLRAREWCEEGSLKHLLHSITRPPELRYKDLLDQIADSSRQVDRLAVAGAQAEIREMNGKLTAITAQLSAIQASQALHSSALVNTNRQLSDLQFSQVMAFMSKGQIGDPLVSYRFNRSLQARLGSVQSTTQIVNRFWQSPKLHDWDAGPQSRVAVIKGNFNARFAIKRFTVDVIAQLQAKRTPVLWALPWPSSASEGRGAAASPIDLFKHLILQALQLGGTDAATATESGMALECARFQRATTEHQWAELLGSALASSAAAVGPSTNPQVGVSIYVVVDLSILDPSLEPGTAEEGKEGGGGGGSGFSWLDEFRNLLAALNRQNPNLKIKILLLNYGRDHLRGSHPDPDTDVVIPARATQVPVSRKQSRMAGGNNRPWLRKRVK
ncbi:hypothetical protein QBC42DRAFT_73782 [Cladorrhinum samala]|uniref:DUF7708 domain-containing protein n=1 Tax=Cladorrhinum samala TaxID=585594 RepID=A0AAV9HST9_9PEZI|nr:hypothetical protein QBC42DRAFT_73782 [Cladorrhinum samala]